MNRFWGAVIQPLLDAVDARRVVEVGAESGLQTRPLLQHCRQRGAVAHVVDPRPTFDVESWSREFGDTLVFHRQKSLEVLGTIPPVDVALLDGDHNWYTVYHELELLEQRAREHNVPPPVVAVHDVGWPYGRRDLYYEPHDIPPEFRHPNSRSGMRPGEPALVGPDGLNAHLANALTEGSSRNGVLTAVEDFVAASREQITIVKLGAFHGLAVLAPGSRLAATPDLERFLKTLRSKRFLGTEVELVEAARVEEKIRGDAAARARGRADARFASRERQLAERSARLFEAGQELERVKSLAAEEARAHAERERAVERIRAELDGAVARSTRLEQRVAELAREREDASSRASTTEAALQEVRAAAEAREQAIQRLRGQLAESRAERDRLAASLEATERAVESGAAVAAQRERAYEELRQEHLRVARQAERAKAELSEVRDAGARAQRRVDQLERERTAASDRLAKEALSLQEARRVIRRLEAVHGELARVAAQAERAQGQLREARSARLRLADRLQAVERQLDDVTARADAAAEALNDARVSSEHRESAIELLRSELADAVGETERVRDELLAANDAYAALRDTASATEEELRGVDERREHAERDQRRLIRRERELGLALQRLKADVAAASGRQAQALDRLAGSIEREGQVLASVEVDAVTAALHVRRAAESRAWRIGHRLTTLFRWLTFRPPSRREGALELALRSLPDPTGESTAPRQDPLEELKSLIRSARSEHGAMRAELDELITLAERVGRRPQSATASEAQPPRAHEPPPTTTTPAPEEPLPLGPSAHDTSAMANVEAFALAAFRARYNRLVTGAEPQLGSGWAGEITPVDRGAVLRDEFGQRDSDEPSIDVIVAVHNALADVRLCLWALLEKASYPFRLIVVNDGSDAPTSDFLQSFATRHPKVELIHNHTEPHGYTIAANLGLKASSADYVVLLNSDTVVTHGWLERLVACGDSGETVGIVGPLSNAATHQSVPEVRDAGAWATNPLPPWLDPDSMAFAVARLSERRRPRVPFLNGFCLAVKRATLNRVGFFDEDNFASGYCEENDFAFRAVNAGFELAIADDAYVFHAKSSSYTPAGRARVAKANYEKFLHKHGERPVQARVRELEANSELECLREQLKPLAASAEQFTDAWSTVLDDPLRVLFVLPGLSKGSSGGAHSVYQEVKGMRALGIPAQIAISASAWKHAKAAYSDASEIFFRFGSPADLERAAGEFDVVAATHFRSVELGSNLSRQQLPRLPAYYVQDYEPFFADEGTADAAAAFASYNAIPGQVCFAKTRWLCDLVGAVHGIHVNKVEPSLDHEVYFPPAEARSQEGPVRILAMVRPRTTRRQPFATVQVLLRVAAELTDDVDIAVFGCDDRELARMAAGASGGTLRNLGILTREGVANALRQADLFVDCSFYQAFGRTALEAMACGCTSVVPSLGGVSEFAHEGENAVLVDSTDPDAVFEAITSLVRDRDRLGRLQANAIQTAQRYSIPRAALSEYLLFEREYRKRFGSGRRVSPPLLDEASSKDA